jgi:hypothetical protein
MASMASVHENMQQGTGQKQDKRKSPKQVGAMLGQEKERSDRQESQQNDAGPPRERARSIVPRQIVGRR